MATAAMTLPRIFLRTCRRAGSRLKVADSTGMELTGHALLMRSLIVRRLLLRHVVADDEKYVGLLLPPSAAAVVGNAAVTLLRRIAVNLNYTVSPERDGELHPPVRHSARDHQPQIHGENEARSQRRAGLPRRFQGKGHAGR